MHLYFSVNDRRRSFSKPELCLSSALMIFRPLYLSVCVVFCRRGFIFISAAPATFCKPLVPAVMKRGIMSVQFFTFSIMPSLKVNVSLPLLHEALFILFLWCVQQVEVWSEEQVALCLLKNTQRFQLA